MFKIPKTILEAERRLDAAIADINRIQSELGKRKLTDGSPGYLDWRQKALDALNNRMAEQRQIKAWLASQPGLKSQAVLDILVPRRLLRKAVAIFDEFAEQDFSEEEKQIIESIRTYINQVDQPVGPAAQ